MLGSVHDNLLVPSGVELFDAIVSIEVIEHPYDSDRFAKSAYEALHPGGIPIVTTPYWGYLKNITLAVTNRMDRALIALWPGGHIKHWSYTALLMLLERNRFEF